MWQLNQPADWADLYIILSGDAASARKRAEKRGLYSRFHRSGYVISMAEGALDATAAADQTEHGFEVLVHDIDAQTPGQAAEALAAAVLARRETQPDAS